MVKKEQSIQKFLSSNMGSSDLGWLQSKFHFSFADYYNPNNINFGVLRVINDDLIAPNTGFDEHPHKNMEIVSYVIDSELTHKDSMGNERTLSRGNFQYMSAGTGVRHSEYNNSEKTTRILQIWILPDDKNYTPNYGDFIYDAEKRKNKLFHAVSSKKGEAPIKIHQDANIYVAELDKGNKLEFSVNKERQCYVVQIEGSSQINEEILDEKDGLTSIEQNLTITSLKDSHILIIEMAKL